MVDIQKAKKPVELSAIPFVKLGFLINRFIVKTNITPNQLTFIAFMFGILCAVFIGSINYYSFFGLTPYWQGIIGAIFGLLFFQFDIQDGQLARSKGMCTKLGAWLDTVFGIVSIELVILAIILHMWSLESIILGIFAIIAYPMHFMFIHQFKNEFSDVLKLNKNTILNTKKIWIKYLYGQAIFYPIVFFFYLVNQQMMILYFYAILGNLYWIVLLFLQYRTLRGL